MPRTDPLTLEGVRVRPVLVPLHRPVVAKVGHYERWPLILIDAECAGGVVGRAYLEPYIAKSARYLVPAIEDLAEALAGKPIAPLDAYASGRKALNLIGYEGAAMIAVSGLDMALWDARARAAGLPLAVMLGGALGPVPAYNSNGLWLTPLAGHEREAEALAAEGGFDAVKLRLGRDALEDDLQAIAAVRRALGGGARIMTDFNQGQTLGAALDRCHALDDQGLVWFEEPVAYDDIAGHARLAADLKTPVQLGENFYGPRALHEALAAEASDYVMPDLMRIGGVTGWLRAAAIAGGFGIQLSSHLYPEFSAHLLRVSETAHWLEWQDWANPVLRDPYPVRGGALRIPDTPGVGLEWDEAAVARYAM